MILKIEIIFQRSRLFEQRSLCSLERRKYKKIQLNCVKIFKDWVTAQKMLLLNFTKFNFIVLNEEVYQLIY